MEIGPINPSAQLFETSAESTRKGQNYPGGPIIWMIKPDGFQLPGQPITSLGIGDYKNTNTAALSQAG